MQAAVSRLASWLVVALALIGAAVVASTSGALPPRVASHFGAGGAANGWMTRENYTWFMMLLTALLPLALLLALAWLPARFERWVNLPHREYWMASPQRAATLDSLRVSNSTSQASQRLSPGILLSDAASSRVPRQCGQTMCSASDIY